MPCPLRSYGDLVESVPQPFLRCRVTNERHYSADVSLWLNGEESSGSHTYSTEWTGFDPDSIQYIEYIFTDYPTWFHFNLRFGGLG